MHDCREKIITVNASLTCIQLREHLVGVAHVEVRAKGKLAALLLKLALDLRHVADGLREVAPTCEETVGHLLTGRREEDILPLSQLLNVRRRPVKLLAGPLHLMIGTV